MPVGTIGAEEYSVGNVRRTILKNEAALWSRSAQLTSAQLGWADAQLRQPSKRTVFTFVIPLRVDMLGVSNIVDVLKRIAAKHAR